MGVRAPPRMTEAAMFFLQMTIVVMGAAHRSGHRTTRDVIAPVGEHYPAVTRFTSWPMSTTDPVTVPLGDGVGHH